MHSCTVLGSSRSHRRFTPVEQGTLFSAGPAALLAYLMGFQPGGHLLIRHASPFPHQNRSECLTTVRQHCTHLTFVPVKHLAPSPLLSLAISRYALGHWMFFLQKGAFPFQTTFRSGNSGGQISSSGSGRASLAFTHLRSWTLQPCAMQISLCSGVPALRPEQRRC